MKTFLITSGLFPELIESESATEAYSEVVTRVQRIRDVFVDSEQLRQTLMIRGFETLIRTGLEGVLECKK